MPDNRSGQNPDRRREVSVGNQTFDLRVLEQMDDGTLQKIVSMLARAAGVSERQAQQSVSNVQRLRRNIAGMSDDALRNAVRAADTEKAGEIAAMLSNALKKQSGE